MKRAHKCNYGILKVNKLQLVLVSHRDHSTLSPLKSCGIWLFLSDITVILVSPQNMFSGVRSLPYKHYIANMFWPGLIVQKTKWFYKDGQFSVFFRFNGFQVRHETEFDHTL